MKIKLHPNYHGICLFVVEDNDPNNIGEIDVDTARQIGITDETLKELENLSNLRYNWLDWNDPSNEKYISEEEKKYFYSEGIRLWKKLIKELEGKAEVSYYDLEHYLLFENIQDYVNYLEKLSWFNKTISN